MQGPSGKGTQCQVYKNTFTIKLISICRFWLNDSVPVLYLKLKEKGATGNALHSGLVKRLVGECCAGALYVRVGTYLSVFNLCKYGQVSNNIYANTVQKVRRYIDYLL